MKNSQPVREKLLQHSPWIVAIAFGIIVAAYIWTFRALPYNEKTDSWGQFGDLIGGLLNPLISLFTLIVAVSVWKLQKAELAATRKTLEESMNVAKKQANLMNVQRIEQTMFSLIEQLRLSVKEFSIAKHFNRIDGPGDLTGSEAVALLMSNFDKIDYEYYTAPRWFEHLVDGYQVENFDTLALGIKELLTFITRNSSNEMSRKVWFGMSVALLGEKTFALAYKWGEHYGDPILMSCFNDMQTLRSKVNL